MGILNEIPKDELEAQHLGVARLKKPGNITLFEMKKQVEPEQVRELFTIHGHTASSAAAYLGVTYAAIQSYCKDYRIPILKEYSADSYMTAVLAKVWDLNAAEYQLLTRNTNAFPNKRDMTIRPYNERDIHLPTGVVRRPRDFFQKEYLEQVVRDGFDLRALYRLTRTPAHAVINKLYDSYPRAEIMHIVDLLLLNKSIPCAHKSLRAAAMIQRQKSNVRVDHYIYSLPINELCARRKAGIL